MMSVRRARERGSVGVCGGVVVPVGAMRELR